jgi:hypothetical protein
VRAIVASLPTRIDRVVGPEVAGIPRRVREKSLLLSAHPWVYFVSQRQESSAVSATSYGHDYVRSFGRAHREQPVSAITGRSGCGPSLSRVKFSDTPLPRTVKGGSRPTSDIAGSGQYDPRALDRKQFSTLIS